jgi:hypothetical protein
MTPVVGIAVLMVSLFWMGLASAQAFECPLTTSEARKAIANAKAKVEEAPAERRPDAQALIAQAEQLVKEADAIHHAVNQPGRTKDYALVKEHAQAPYKAKMARATAEQALQLLTR